MRLVLDANVFVSSIVHDAFSQAAIEILVRASRAEFDAAAPHALLIESAHALLRLRRMGRITGEIARDGYASALGLPFVRSRDDPLSEADFDLALKYTVGASDFLYVRLARELGCPLVTQDGALRTNAAPLVEVLDLETALVRIASN